MRGLYAIAALSLVACSDDPTAQEQVDLGVDSAADTSADASSDTPTDSGTDLAADVIDTDDTASDVQDDGLRPPAEPDLSPLGGDERPADVFVPADYSIEREWPLAILLHGYGASSLLQRAYLNVPPLVNDLGFIFVTPDGLVDQRGSQFWNAFPECCDRFGTEVDDVAYLTSLIDEAEQRYAVDRDRIYFFGHSNGGFMSYRMACELGDRVAGIASLAGSMTSDAALCLDTGAVHVLQIHGTEDDAVLYSVAEPSAEFWAERNGCGESSALPNRDLVIGDDDETEVLAWDCPDEAQVELWTIVDDGHLPSINQDFSRQMLTWLFDRPRD